jgi:hypothetical protein
MPVVKQWNPGTNVQAPNIGGAAVTAAIAAAGKGFGAIGDRIREEEEAAKLLSLKEQEMDMKQEKLDFDLAAPEREIELQGKLFEQQQAQKRGIGEALAGINAQLGGSRMEEFRNVDFDKVFKDDERWSSFTPEQKAEWRDQTLAALEADRRLSSDPNVARADARRLYMQHGIVDPDKVSKSVEGEMPSIFGQKADPDVLKAVYANGVSSKDSLSDKLMFEVLKSNMKDKYDEGNYRKNFEFANDWAKSKGLKEQRWKFFGWDVIPDIKKQKVYESQVRQLVNEGIAQGYPASAVLGTLDGMVIDQHLPAGHLNLNEMAGTQQETDFWNAVAGQAQQAGGKTADALGMISALRSGAGGGSGMKTSEFLAASDYQPASDEQLMKFYQGRLTDAAGPLPERIMPAAPNKPAQPTPEQLQTAAVNQDLDALFAAEAKANPSVSLQEALMPKREDYAAGRQGARKYNRERNQAAKLFEASPEGQAIELDKQIASLEDAIKRSKRPTQRRNLIARLEALQATRNRSGIIQR